MKAWFDDPQQLVEADKVSQFWPTVNKPQKIELMRFPILFIYAPFYSNSS